MKLRGQKTLIQLLFAGLLILGIGNIAIAQDRIVTKDRRTLTGSILGCDGRNINFKMDAGTIGVPLASVARISMNPPADMVKARKAFSEGEFGTALGKARGLVKKYRGLPADWTRQATALLGDIYVSMNDTVNAEKAYKDFQKYYPAAGTERVDIGMARIAIARKEYAAARTKLQPIADKALKEKNPDPARAGGYSQVFLLLGQCAEADDDYTAALQHYLRTVTIFPQDSLAADAAQKRADAIRKEHKVTAP
jgi:tetratricopeptide (TPR) repeat protein